MNEKKWERVLKITAEIVTILTGIKALIDFLASLFQN